MNDAATVLPSDLDASCEKSTILHRLPSWIIGLVSGGAAALNWLANMDAGFRPESMIVTSHTDVIVSTILGALIGLGFIVLLGRFTSRAVAELGSPARRTFRRFDALTSAPLLLMLMGIHGVRFPPMLLLILAVIAAKGVLLFGVLPANRKRDAFSSLGWLGVLFLISGFAALIYQIVWQRTLYATYGVNIESITIIVALFMLGLGIGSMVGGIFAKKYPDHAPTLFLACELGIGLFGIGSVPLIKSVAAVTLDGSLWSVSVSIFCLLIVPTMLMGATLPILVGHVCRTYRNVGKSVGMLYAINTLGSALACFLTTDLLFVIMGQQSAVLIAASCNLLVGVLVWRYIQRTKSPAEPAKAEVAEVAEASITPANRGCGVAILAMVFAAITGYISLSQEIVWMRLVSYLTGSKPSVFAHVLGFFLIGVTLGAMFGKRYCERVLAKGKGSAFGFVGGMMLLSAAFYYLSITTAAWVNEHSYPACLALTHLIVAAVAFILGGVFPVLCHVGTRPGENAGMSVARIYVANIVGCTAGPLLTGFVIMDFLGTGQIALLLSLMTLLAAAAASLIGRQKIGLISAAVCLLVGMGCWVGHDSLYANLLARMERSGAGTPYNHLQQTRSGVIGVREDPRGDIIFGSGMYDGRFNVDPTINSNWIMRCYMLAGLHPNPTSLLEVGLSSGSWTAVVADYSPLKTIDVVEIDPGYCDILKDYDPQKTLLDDPRVKIHIDDGRRWLNRHPDRTFDVILQNTTWHWRSFASNLLSEDYFRLCKKHLNPGGILYCNTTGSDEVVFTAAKVYKYVARYYNFVAMSDSPFIVPEPLRRANLLKFVDDKGVIFARPEHKAKFEELATDSITEIGDEMRARTDLLTITDDNMATEYKLHRWQNSQATWGNLWENATK